MGQSESRHGLKLGHGMATKGLKENRKKIGKRGIVRTSTNEMLSLEQMPRVSD